VGDVKEVRPDVLRTLEAGGFVPVIAPIGAGEGGEAYNINGDTAAAAVAAAVSAEKFILLTDVAGVLDAKGGRISTMTGAEAESAIRSGAITGGMIPKVECGLAALRAGVRKVHILDGRVSHSVLLEIFTDAGIGTEIVRADRGAGAE
jgi:acetylglutamate kinase